MILQALKEYYDRKTQSDNASLPPEGWEDKEIRYVITIDQNGNVIDIEDTQEIQDKKKYAKKCRVPKGETRTSNAEKKPYLFWDSTEFVFAISSKKPSKKKEREINKEDDNAEDNVPDKKAQAKNRAFIENIRDFQKKHNTDDYAIKALLLFYEKNPNLPALVQEKFPGKYENMLKGGQNNCSFICLPDTCLICERPEIKALINNSMGKTSEKQIICLVSGQKDIPARIHPQIKGVRDANSTGAYIVSFQPDAFCSYGKKQGENAQTGEKAAFAYGASLNCLLGKDSRQKIQIGDSSVVFWAAKRNDLENDFGMFFTDIPKDNPDGGTAAVKNIFDSIKSGVYTESDEKTEFYVLGLSPNSARLAVRFWIKSPVSGIKKQVRQHFDDMEIIHKADEPPLLPFYRILSATALEGKRKNVPPKLAGELMYSILQGLPYPQTLLNAIINRIKAEHSINYVRAAVLKAIINRNLRFKNSKEDYIKVSLDKETENTAYRLGRLFAVLEKIQSEAQPGINATIRERFYGAASSTPITVFGNLLRLKNHHLAKIENTGKKIYFENLLSEIMGSLPAAGFPAHLSLQDQGRFAIGYYHQTQDIYTKKNKGE